MTDEATITQRVYVGCSTDAPEPGIHVFDLDLDGHGPALRPRQRIDDIDRPSYLVAHPTEPIVYAVSETVDGGVVELHVDPVDGSLRPGRRVPSHGDAPCHLGTDGDRLYVANYGSGSVAAYRLLPDGRIGELAWTAQHHGSGPHPRQDAPHAHCAVADPRRASVHVVDLGTDRVVRYDVDPSTTTLRAAHELALAPGSGPRHLAFHPSDPTAYVVCELDCTLVELAVLDRSGELRPSVVVSTLREGAPDSLAAAVRIHPDGHRVYVSNRGDDSIATFATGGPHAPLTLLGHVSSGGRAPRDLAIDRTGRLLLAANQAGGEITGFAIAGDGTPRPLGTLAAVAAPSCILVTESRGPAAGSMKMEQMEMER